MVTIKVFDITGRQVQQLQGVPGQAIKFGDKIVNGTYFVEVRQGSEKVVIKIIKQ
jgi:hypothetical protein